MLRKNKFYLIILIQLLFLIAIFLLIPSLFIREKNGISQTNFENILILDHQHVYLEEFISDQNNLNSVSLLLKNPALNSHDSVYIELLDQNQQPIQSLVTSGVSIGDPSWIRLKFLPINSQAGDKFFIKISSDALKDNDLYVYGNSENQSINYKTTYKSPSFKDSFKDNFNYQKEKLSELNKGQGIFYLLLLISINILLYSSL